MARTSRSAKATIDHDTIREWVARKGGHPASVKRTGGGDDPGILRIDFPGFSGEQSLTPISWDKFFESFEANKLAFIYQDLEDSRFNKLVNRDTIAERYGEKLEGAGVESQGAAAEAGEGGAQEAAAAGDVSEEGGALGRVSALSLLAEQHREVKQLFAEYHRAKENAETEQEQGLFEKIANNLAAHSEIEERIFYPTVMASRTAEELREAVEEHLAVKRVIADLLEMKVEDPQFEGKMKVMEDLVDHHVDEEEHKLFDIVQQIDEESLYALGDMMKNAYESLMQERPRKNVPRETSSAAPLT